MKHGTLKHWLRCALAALALAVALPAALRADEDHERARALREAGEVLGLEEILGRARAQYPGRVIETELEYEGGRYIYEVELVDPQGIVRELRFDAKTGDLVGTERGH